jgi:hypothetical protein
MRTACALLCFVACAASFAAEPPLACKTSLVPLKYRQPVEDLATGKLPIPDYQDAVIACLTSVMPGLPRWVAAPTPAPAPLAASAWLDSERARYAAVLAKQPADILVVPFQVQGYGLDRIERTVMTADLAYAIGDASALRVADPFLTALALGEGDRRIDSHAVERLAQQIGARGILFGYVGHDLKHAFTLTLKLQETSASSASQPWQRDWRSVSFSNEKPPAYVLHGMLPGVLKDLPLGLAPKPAAAAPITAAPSRISASPLEFVSAGASAGSGIARISLLATLLPGGAELARERMFERVLVAAIRENSSQPAQRFFESYALFNLHRRPVALARIEGANGQSFTALRALLDGNLPAARSATREVKNPMEQLLLQILLRDLEYDYGIEEPTEPTAVKVLLTEQLAPAWAGLLLARLEDRNKWFTPNAESIKTAFDQAFPSEELALGSIVRGGSIARGAMPDEVDIDLANIRHAHRVTATLQVSPCCRTRNLQPARWDLLWLLEGLAEDRIDRDLQAMIFIQADSAGALAAIARYEPMLTGHPRMTALSASAAIRAAAKSRDDTRASWTARGLQDGRSALRWSQGQNRAAYEAALSLGIPSPDSEIWLDVYGYDFPRRPDWPIVFLGSEDESAEVQRLAFASEAHAFSTSDLSPLSEIRGAAREATLASLGSRFTGHPARPTSQSVTAMPGTSEARIAAARAAAQGDPNMNWALGYQMLYSEHPFKEALDAFLAYPPFQTRNARDGVMLANNAYDTGSRFFWLGQGELAKPLFQIAADLDTGSDSSMASEQRLRLLAGDYRGAAEAAHRRSLRYSSSYAQRDYLSLLHAFGEHDAAWSAFSQLRTEQSDPSSWVSAIVGHRMQRLDEHAVRSWLKTPEIRDAKFKAQLFASYYAVVWNSTDRTPPADLGALVEELEGKPVARIDYAGVIRPHPVDPSGFELVRPTFVPVQAVGTERYAQGTPIKSERAYFADAYSAVVRAEYSKAVDRFAAMARLYPLDGAPMPYFSYAASKTGDTLQFEKYVATPKPYDYENFDVMLSRAFFAAGRKQVDESYRLLNLAFRAKPYNGERPLDAHYQFAQACEWLYRDTKDPRFAATLLEWAKSYQSIQPAIAWGYAVQYQYEKDPQARIQALAMTQYLDPLSNRIRGASKADIEKAQGWFATNNPFRIRRDPDHNEIKHTTAALY